MSGLPVDPHLYSTFLGVMAVMAITPGPANLFAIATGMQKGKAAALVGVAGMNTGTLTWFAAADVVMGRGPVPADNPRIFNAREVMANLGPAIARPAVR